MGFALYRMERYLGGGLIMPKYTVKLARIEHHVYYIEVDAKDEEEATEKAYEVFEAPDFDTEDYDIVHADEFISDIDCEDE